MRKIFGILLLLIIAFTSCEGRKSQSQALYESIEAFKKEVTLEVNTYYPENYEERQVDTLLNNGYHVKIRTYSDMKNNVLFTKIKDTINYQNYYRNYKFDIKIEKDGELIYDKSFDKEEVNKVLGYSPSLDSNSLTTNFDTQAVLKSIQINIEESINTEFVVLNLGYAIPSKDYIDWHFLKIDEYGNESFIKTEIN